jgi:hypothetical protein
VTKKIKHPVVLTMFVLYTLAILFLLVIPNNYRGHNVLVGGLTWDYPLFRAVRSETGDTMYW